MRYISSVLDEFQQTDMSKKVAVKEVVRTKRKKRSIIRLQLEQEARGEKAAMGKEERERYNVIRAELKLVRDPKSVGEDRFLDAGKKRPGYTFAAS